MGVLTRDDGDPMDDTRPGAYVSDRGWTYRLLASVDIPAAWFIYPETSGDLAWLGRQWPAYVAIPQFDETCGYIYGYAVYRADQIRDGVVYGEPVGYARNLGDMCWPAEENLIVVIAESAAIDVTNGQEG